MSGRKAKSKDNAEMRRIYVSTRETRRAKGARAKDTGVPGGFNGG